MDLTGAHVSRNINRVIIGIIVLLVSAIIFLFIRHRLLVHNIPATPPPPQTNATLTIKEFQHTASENGMIQWTLTADSASMYSTENMVKLNHLMVAFSGKNGRNLTIRADQGVLDVKTNDMHLSGNIRAELSTYLLVTESLNYHHHSRIIQIETPVELTGPLMTLTAETMIYTIETARIECSGNVNGVFVDPHDPPRN